MKNATRLNYPDGFRPLAVSFGAVAGDGMRLVNLHDTVTISSHQKEISSILELCNGFRTSDDIYEKIADIDRGLFDTLIILLRENGVVVDSREFYQVYHKYAAFPHTVSYDVTLEAITAARKSVNHIPTAQEKCFPLPSVDRAGVILSLSERKSTRTFSKAALSPHQLAGLLQSMYGCLPARTIPSAGGFYALQLHILLLKSVGELQQGLYCYNPSNHNLWSPAGATFPTKQHVSMLFNAPDMIDNATCCIAVVGEIAAPNIKYSNRAYRHILLEAGHIAQNAYIYAAEQQFGVVEHGGFNDDELARLLQIDYPRVAVLTAIVAGGTVRNQPVVVPSTNFTNLEYLLRKNLVHAKSGPLLSTSSYTLHKDFYTMPYYVASCKYFPRHRKRSSAGKPRSAYGIGTTLEEAKFKAMVEGFERYSCSNFRVDVRASAQELDAPAIDLAALGPQRSAFTERMGISRQDACLTSRAWVRGRYVQSGDAVYVPADQVFFPLPTHESASYSANSSGVAAHCDQTEAVKNALYELIERDAFSVAWYCKKVCKKISHTSLSTDLRHRLQHLSRIGCQVVFLDLTLELTPVIGCIILSEEYPHTTFGCAAHSCYESALTKALNEAEFIHHIWQKGARGVVDMKDIRSTTDHGDFYATHHIREFSELTWLLSGATVDLPKECGLSYEEIIERVRPVAVKLSEDGATGLNCVRVLSEFLMPITFGFGSEHYRHPRTEALQSNWAWEYPAMPHLLA